MRPAASGTSYASTVLSDPDLLDVVVGTTAVPHSALAGEAPTAGRAPAPFRSTGPHSGGRADIYEAGSGSPPVREYMKSQRPVVRLTSRTT